MRIKKFRVRNYKSIVDSGDCWLASDVTTLAGKNESGKSALLEALRDFDRNWEISEAAAPLSGEGNTSITLWLSVSREEAGEIVDATGLEDVDHLVELWFSEGIELTKTIDGYSISPEVAGPLDLEQGRIGFQKATSLLDVFQLGSLAELPAVPLPLLGGDIRVDAKAIDAFLAVIAKQVSGIVPGDLKANYLGELATLREMRSGIPSGVASDLVADEIAGHIPTFVFFSDFEDLLPNEVEVNTAHENGSVRDFAKISGLDLAKLAQTGDRQRRVNYLSRHSAQISDAFLQHWHQDRVFLDAMADGDKLQFWVREENNTEHFRADQRSRGFQWFLSFFLRLQAEGGDTNLVLIDEPGLYLHAKAQGDVLTVLEALPESSQVVISTHSPYLIRANRLDRVRLVVNDRAGNERQGTKVENKAHRGSDIDTMTPIVTALGLDVSNSLSTISKKSVFVEGISDYYYLEAMRLILGLSPKAFSIVPAVGATKVPILASLAIGWGLQWLALLDNDREGRSVARELQEELRVEPSHVVMASDIQGYATEDLFDPEDFRRLVLREKGEAEIGEGKNSEVAKRRSKAVLAKQFLDGVRSDPKTKLSAKTRKTFGELFEKLEKVLN